MSAPQIAKLYLTDADHVRKVIHDFNDRGFGALDADYRGGRPRKTTPEQRDEIVSVARARPDSQGVALTRWSIDKLARHWPSSRSQASHRPPCGRCWTTRDCRFSGRDRGDAARSGLQAEAERVPRLYRDPPTDGPVACFDEMGPIQLIAPGRRSAGPKGCVRRMSRLTRR
jgi:transposase